MYPNTFFNLFPAFPRDYKVFVAMSFDPRFDSRWENVITPAVKNVRIGGVSLEPYRVDVRHVSDSILTEILEGVSNSRLFLADVTTTAYVQDMSVRNANVMYEVGLAHAVRLPEEVILFRSDNDRLLFDVANVRVNYYSPDDDPDAARKLVSQVIIETYNEIEMKKQLAVGKAALSLDFVSWVVLSDATVGDGIEPPSMNTMKKALGNAARQSAISRLLDMGALITSYLTLTPKMLESPDEPLSSIFRYRITPFGEAILKYAAEKMGMFSPEMRAVLEKRFGEGEKTEEK